MNGVKLNPMWVLDECEANNATRLQGPVELL